MGWRLLLLNVLSRLLIVCGCWRFDCLKFCNGIVDVI